MNGFLLDTNVISEYAQIRPPDVRVKTWIDGHFEEDLYLSVLTLGEMRKGTTLLPPGKKREQLEKWLETDFLRRFGNRLLPVNSVIAELWGDMAARAQRRGVAVAIIDGLMAATAKHHDLTVVTRNVRDFSMWDVPVTDPWHTA